MDNYISDNAFRKVHSVSSNQAPLVLPIAGRMMREMADKWQTKLVPMLKAELSDARENIAKLREALACASAGASSRVQP